MKIKTILLACLIAIITISCSNKEPKVAYIAGTYNGYSLASCTMFTDYLTENEVVHISENADGSAKVEFDSESWGTFVVANASMTESEGVYTLSGSGKVEMGMGGQTSSYDFTLSTSIRSFSDAQMTFSVPAVMGGLTINFKTGNAPQE